MAIGNLRGGATALVGVICANVGSLDSGGRLSICAPRPAVSSEYMLYAGTEISAATEPAVSRSGEAVACAAESAAALAAESDSSTMHAVARTAAVVSVMACV